MVQMQSLRSLVVKTPQKYGTDQVNIFGSVKEPKKSLCLSVCLSVRHKLVYSSESSSFSHRSVSSKSQVSLKSDWETDLGLT